jgi:DNA-binding CsgD family transcriptional regulator
MTVHPPQSFAEVIMSHPTDRGNQGTEYLDQAMQMLQTLLELHPQAAVIADTKGHWVIANRAFGSLFGISTSPQSLSAAWSTHFSGALRTDDLSPGSGLPGERPTVDLRFGMRKQDGNQSCFIAHGTILDRKGDGNDLIAWTFFEAGTKPEHSTASSAMGGKRESFAEGAYSSKDAPKPGQERKDNRDCPVCIEKSREALRILMHHTNEQRLDMERRIAENYLLTVLPLIEHLKSMNLPESQAYLLETLEFNLRHINSVFRIKVPSAKKPLSQREIQICQMIRAGQSSGQIAQALGLKLQTVMVHRKHIRRKLGLRNGSVRLSVFLQRNLDPLY